MAWRLTWLAVLGHTLRSRRSFERVAFAAIILAALSKLGQENRTRTFARLAAWGKRQVQLVERAAERQATRVARKAKGTLTAG